LNRKGAVILLFFILSFGIYLYGEQWEQTSWSGGVSAGSVVSVNSNCTVFNKYTNIIPGNINVQPDTSSGGIILQTSSITDKLAFYEHFDDTSKPYRGYAYDGTYWDGTGYYSSQIYSEVNRYGGYSLDVQNSRECVLSFYDISLTNYISPEAGTIELWVKPRTPFANESGEQKFCRLKFSGDRRIQIGVTNGFLSYGGYIDYSQWHSANYDASSMTNSEWVHLAVVWDRTTGTNYFYVNGKLAAASKPSGDEAVDRADLSIGGEGGYSSSYLFNGYIDEFMIFNYAKTSNEILAEGSVSYIDSAIIKLVGGAKYNNISWSNSEGTRIGGAAPVRFKFRTTVDDGSGNPATARWTAWLGPDGTTNTYYTNSGQAISTNHYGDMYFQYRAFFNSSAPYFSKKLNSVTIDYTLLSAVTSATAEIIPTFIEIGSVTSKTLSYYIKPEITGGRTGINLINIVIPSAVQFKGIVNVSLQNSPYTSDPGTYSPLSYPSEYSNYINSTNLYITLKSNMVDAGRRIKIDFIITNIPSSKSTIYFRSYVDDTITITPADTVHSGNSAATGDMADANSFGLFINSYRNPATVCYGEITPNFGYIYKASPKKFYYYIKPIFGPGDSGFNYIKVILPDSFTIPSSVNVLRNNSSTLFTNKSDGRNIIVALPSKVSPQNNDLITLEFTTMPTKNGKYNITGIINDTDYLSYPSISITSGDATADASNDDYSVVGSYNYIPGDVSQQEDEMYVVYDKDVSTRLIIEKGTFNNDVLISIDKVISDITNMTFNITAKDNNGNYVHTFNKNINLQIHFDDSDNDGYIDNIYNERISVSEADKRLGMYYFDGVKWLLIGKNVDTSSCLVKAEISHFSLYSVRVYNFAASENVFKTGEVLYTNPITPNNDGINDFSTFTINNVENPELKIYDINGNFIIDLTEDIINNGEVSTVIWNGTYDNGDIVPAGIYVYFLTGNDFSSKGTILVVR